MPRRTRDSIDTRASIGTWTGSIGLFEPTYERLIHKTATFCSFRSVLRACRDAGNGKKGTKLSPQQDKAAADAAGRKTASVPGSESKMAEGNQSPPKAEVDDSPLQHAMDRNKECEYIFPFDYV